MSDYFEALDECWKQQGDDEHDAVSFDTWMKRRAHAHGARSTDAFVPTATTRPVVRAAAAPGRDAFDRDTVEARIEHWRKLATYLSTQLHRDKHCQALLDPSDIPSDSEPTRRT